MPPADYGNWLWFMFGWSVVGALIAMFWPAFIAIFRTGPSGIRIYRAIVVGSISAATTTGIGNWIRFLAVSVLIAVVVSGLGFVAFIRGEDTQQDLHSLGVLAYFMAFTYGFGAGSAIEEPLEK